MRTRHVNLWCASAVVLTAFCAIAAAQSDNILRFDVAAIKPVAFEQGQYHGGACHGVDSPLRPNVVFSPPPLGRCVFPNTVLGNIIEFAYGEPNKPPFGISGGDKWVNSDPFEVQASAENPATTTEAQLREMLHTLLRERFGLQFHREVRDEQGFALLSANNGKSLPAPTGKEARPGPAFVHRDGAEIVVTGEQITITTLLNFLSGDLHQRIQDETGLTGIYNVSLRFTPGAGESTAVNADGPETPGPSLFTALQDQLGLKLTPRKIPVEFFVIDHAERPKN